MKTTALALALLTSLAPAAAPLAGLATVGNAAIGNAAAKTAVQTGPTVSSTWLNVAAGRQVQTGTEGDTTLWTVDRASVGRQLDAKTGMLVISTEYLACPAGVKPLEVTYEEGTPTCEFLEGGGTTIAGDQVSVVGDEQLGAIRVTGPVEVFDPAGIEEASTAQASITFTGTGTREAFGQLEGDWSTSGWTRDVTADGAAGPVQLDGFDGEATWRTDVSPKPKKATITQLSARHESLVSEVVLDKVFWRQTIVAAGTSSGPQGGTITDLSGSIEVFVCEPGVHPIEDVDREVDAPACPSDYYEIRGEDIQMSGDKKLDVVTVAGTATVDGEETLLDLTFTGVGKATTEKVTGEMSGRIVSRDATISGFLGEEWFVGEPADLMYSKQSGYLQG